MNDLRNSLTNIDNETATTISDLEKEKHGALQELSIVKNNFNQQKRMHSKLLDVLVQSSNSSINVIFE